MSDASFSLETKAQETEPLEPGDTGVGGDRKKEKLGGVGGRGGVVCREEKEEFD